MRGKWIDIFSDKRLDSDEKKIQASCKKIKRLFLSVSESFSKIIFVSSDMPLSACLSVKTLSFLSPGERARVKQA